MRIISGECGGRRLFSLDGRDTRPTADKVKESLFNILASYMAGGESVLDLFAGSGALGLECLSRGAGNAVFVEKSRRAAEIVRKNISVLGYNEKSCVVLSDYVKYLDTCHGQFDFIFIDPPYASGFYNTALDLIKKNRLLKPDGAVILEHDAGYEVPEQSDYDIIKEKHYGKSKITILKDKEDTNGNI
ncbi:MAG: 16S rRNA (guanine(966)-N(2))-methyltransferase RsmD [Clostridia bacterium]|nr:16S rRNA (guanine(966)-N(2))-methyltransferase RsmD [Clostridia bacterium]